jgi:hypothetical protein
VALISAGSRAAAQISPASFPGPAPATAAAVGAWDVGIVKRAEQLLATPAQWNRVDTGTCPAMAQTFSIGCALQKAIEAGAGIHRERGPRVAGNDKSPPATCAFHPIPTGWEGSCGSLFDEVPVFTIARAERITSGAWRSDIHPMAVWSGRRADAESPVEDEADNLVGSLTRKKYDEPLVGYNNDSTTTFADVQRFFQLLGDRVAANGATDLVRSGGAVEIEIYPGGTGVMRIYAGWFAVSGFMAADSVLRFRVDTVKELPPSALDRQILERAAQIITADSVWNRADNRKCPATATKWSIYCAVERAEVAVAGGFHHRRPAMELVREIVDERTKAKSYQHRLMDYNNDPTTHLDDVRTLFAEAIQRIKG